MTVDPIAILFFTLTVATLSVVLVFLARGYTHTTERLHHLEEANSHMQSQLAEKPIKLLEHAHAQAQELIDMANKQALDIIANSKTYEGTSNQAIKDKLAALENQQAMNFTKLSQDMQQTYQKMMAQVQEESINILRTVTKDIESDVIADFKELRDVLEKETISAEKVAKEKIDEEYLAMEKDLESYRKQKYQKIDEDIYNILYRVSEMVLNQGISYDKHKELVLGALETAKKEQVFQ